MDSQGLFKVEDVNSIIKLFAFSIQERFEELDGMPRNVNGNETRYMANQSMDESEHLIRKYRNYFTSQEKEIKYLEKFVVRILQILEFFKLRSKSQQILTLAIKKIEEKLNKVVKSVPVDVQRLYSYIIDLTKNGFCIKKTPFRDRRLSLKRMDASQQQRSIQKNKEVVKENAQEEFQEPRIASTANPNNRRRRPVSLSAKRVNKPQMVKEPIENQVSRLYSILQIEQPHIMKIIETKDKAKLERQQLKQNAPIVAALSNYEKYYLSYMKRKQKCDTTLKEVNNRACIRPVVNNWISRKRKMTECRKKPIDSQNMFLM